MRFASAVALAAAVVTVAAAYSPADAQSRRYYRGDRSERITFIDESGRARTKITVRPRSYLDGGTEVSPGERKFFDYAPPAAIVSRCRCPSSCRATIPTCPTRPPVSPPRQ
jgi:hypothetical protein